MEPRSFWDGSPKSLFVTGLCLGIAASAVLAIALGFGMVTGGRLQAIMGARVADQGGTAQPLPQQPTDVPTAPPAVLKKAVSDTDHILGNKNAKVTLVEYSDFECPFCKRHAPTVAQALKDFPNDVRIVYRHYPLSFHPNAQKAAEASECASKLAGNDGFWKMHDKIFAAESLGADVFARFAKEISLNESAFKTCLDSGEMAGRVSADQASGNDSGVEGTPATFVNGKLVSGAVPYDVLKAEIKAAGGSK